MVDLVGFGVAIATGKQFVESFPERCYKSILMPIMLEDNRAGKYEFVIGLLQFEILKQLNNICIPVLAFCTIVSIRTQPQTV